MGVYSPELPWRSKDFFNDNQRLTLWFMFQVRVFKFLTGKLTRVFDESLQTFSELQQMRQQLPDMEFGRRMAAERDLQKSDAFSHPNIGKCAPCEILEISWLSNWPSKCYVNFDSMLIVYIFYWWMIGSNKGYAKNFVNYCQPFWNSRNEFQIYILSEVLC